MDINNFLIRFEEAKNKNSIWFELESDPIGTDHEIIFAEEQLSVLLPSEYKLFTKKFGGGYFAFTNIFSVKNSEWNIIQWNKNLGTINSHSFLAVSSNESGDFYGFKVNNGVCKPEVKVYNHENEQIESTGYKNLFEYLLNVGLNDSASLN